MVLPILTCVLPLKFSPITRIVLPIADLVTVAPLEFSMRVNLGGCSDTSNQEELVVQVFNESSDVLNHKSPTEGLLGAVVCASVPPELRQIAPS